MDSTILDLTTAPLVSPTVPNVAIKQELAHNVCPPTHWETIYVLAIPIRPSSGSTRRPNCART